MLCFSGICLGHQSASNSNTHSNSTFWLQGWQTARKGGVRSEGWMDWCRNWMTKVDLKQQGNPRHLASEWQTKVGIQLLVPYSCSPESQDPLHNGLSLISGHAWMSHVGLPSEGRLCLQYTSFSNKGNFSEDMTTLNTQAGILGVGQSQG